MSRRRMPSFSLLHGGGSYRAAAHARPALGCSQQHRQQQLLRSSSRSRCWARATCVTRVFPARVGEQTARAELPAASKRQCRRIEAAGSERQFTLVRLVSRCCPRATRRADPCNEHTAYTELIAAASRHQLTKAAHTREAARVANAVPTRWDKQEGPTPSCSPPRRSSS